MVFSSAKVCRRGQTPVSALGAHGDALSGQTRYAAVKNGDRNMVVLYVPESLSQDGSAGRL
jgi:hypothetical protein